MSDISVGSVSVSVVPSTETFVPRLREDLEGSTGAIGEDIGRQIGGRITPLVSDSITKGVTEGGAKAAGPASAAGEMSGGFFAETFRRQVQAALEHLPEPKVGIDATEADVELAHIREELRTLGAVGIDVDAAAALGRIDEVRAKLDELGARSPDIRVQVDAAQAEAELAAIRGEVAAVGSSSGESSFAVSNMLSGILALSPAIVAAGAAGVGALAGIGAAALTAVGAVGVLALVFSGVAKAVQLLGQEQQDQAAASAQDAAQAASKAAAEASAARQLSSAQASLANARSSAADAAVSAAERVRNAEQSLGNTEQQVARDRVTAARQVASAEATLTAANQAAAAAQKALNDAREQAARDLEDAANRQTDAQLAARQAALDLAAAGANLISVEQSGTATAVQRQQAALSVQEAEQRLAEARQESTRATQDNTAAQAAGINGDRNVVSAQGQITNALNAQATARQGLSDAQAAQAQQATDGAQKIAAAEQSVADAQRASASQQRSSAFAISQAEGQVANAMASVASAARSSGAAGSSALSKVQEQLAQLPPTTVALAKVFESTVLPIFRNLQGVASAAITPGIVSAIRAAQPLIGPFTGFVSSLASAMGLLFSEASQALTSPFWTQFFGWVSAVAAPILLTMGRTIGAVAQGFAGLLQAFAPVISQIGAGLLTWAQGFAAFGANAGQNSAFQTFLRYVERVGPQLAHTIGSVAGALVHIGAALAPLGPPVLAGIKGLADIIRVIPTPVLTAMAIAIGDIVLALKAWTVVQAVLGIEVAAFDAIPIVAAIAAIIAGVALLVVGIVELVKHWGDIVRGLEVVGGAIASFFEALPGKVLGWFKDAGTWLLQAGKDIIHGLWLGFEYLTPQGEIIKWHSQILHALEAAGTWLVDTGGYIITGLWHGILAAFNFLGDIGKTVKGWFTTAFHDAVHWLVDVGKDVVRGLADGMLRFVEDTVGHIPFIGGRIVKMFKDALGIHSPSTIFAGLGKNLMEGLAVGIVSNAHLPGGALAEVFGQTTTIPASLRYNGMDGSGLHAPTSSASSATAPRGGTLHIEHLEVKGQDRPQATGRELVSSLRKHAYLSGGR